MRTIAALLILRDQIIKPILAGVRTRKDGRKPSTGSVIDQHYETLRLDLRRLFHDSASPHRQRFVDRAAASS